MQASVLPCQMMMHYDEILGNSTLVDELKRSPVKVAVWILDDAISLREETRGGHRHVR